jgi:hypothetical protein
MYSTTYASPTEYTRASRGDYRLVGTFADGTRKKCPITSDEIATAMTPASDSDRDRQRTILDRCFRSDAGVESLTVEASQEAVDWAAWRLLGRVVVTIEGPVTPSRPN